MKEQTPTEQAFAKYITILSSLLKEIHTGTEIQALRLYSSHKGFFATDIKAEFLKKASAKNMKTLSALLTSDINNEEKVHEIIKKLLDLIPDFNKANLHKLCGLAINAFESYIRVYPLTSLKPEEKNKIKEILKIRNNLISQEEVEVSEEYNMGESVYKTYFTISESTSNQIILPQIVIQRTRDNHTAQRALLNVFLKTKTTLSFHDQIKAILFLGINNNLPLIVSQAVLFDRKVVNCVFEDGSRPLELATKIDNRDFIKDLIENGADITFTKNIYSSILHNAFHSGNLELAEKVIDKKLEIRDEINICGLKIPRNVDRDYLVKILDKLKNLIGKPIIEFFDDSCKEIIIEIYHPEEAIELNNLGLVAETGVKFSDESDDDTVSTNSTLTALTEDDNPRKKQKTESDNSGDHGGDSGSSGAKVHAERSEQADNKTKKFNIVISSANFYLPEYITKTLTSLYEQYKELVKEAETHSSHVLENINDETNQSAPTTEFILDIAHPIFAFIVVAGIKTCATTGACDQIYSDATQLATSMLGDANFLLDYVL